MVSNTEKIHTTSDLEQCSRLWLRLTKIQGSTGVTDSFDFRVFYSSLFNSKPFFIYDNLKNPSFIIPLCWNGHVYNWFGTSELNFPPILIDFYSPDTFLSVLKNFNINPILLNVENKLTCNLQQDLLIDKYEKTGTRVVVALGDDIKGHAHWSERNLYRSKKAFDELCVEWELFEKPSKNQVSAVLEDSIAMFAKKEKKSKFTIDQKLRKYIRLFTSDIPGVISIVGDLIVEKDSAVKFLAHIYKNWATVSVIAINVNHKHGKSLMQYGFRYTVSTLPEILHDHFGTEFVDYQGGDHSWKQEVSEACQVDQFRIKLKDGNF